VTTSANTANLNPITLLTNGNLNLYCNVVHQDSLKTSYYTLGHAEIGRFYATPMDNDESDTMNFFD